MLLGTKRKKSFSADVALSLPGVSTTNNLSNTTVNGAAASVDCCFSWFCFLCTSSYFCLYRFSCCCLLLVLLLLLLVLLLLLQRQQQLSLLFFATSSRRPLLLLWYVHMTALEAVVVKQQQQHLPFQPQKARTVYLVACALLPLESRRERKPSCKAHLFIFLLVLKVPKSRGCLP